MTPTLLRGTIVRTKIILWAGRAPRSDYYRVEAGTFLLVLNVRPSEGTEILVLLEGRPMYLWSVDPLEKIVARWFEEI